MYGAVVYLNSHFERSKYTVWRCTTKSRIVGQGRIQCPIASMSRVTLQTFECQIVSTSLWQSIWHQSRRLRESAKYAVSQNDTKKYLNWHVSGTHGSSSSDTERGVKGEGRRRGQARIGQVTQQDGDADRGTAVDCARLFAVRRGCDVGGRALRVREQVVDFVVRTNFFLSARCDPRHNDIRLVGIGGLKIEPIRFFPCHSSYAKQNDVGTIFRGCQHKNDTCQLECQPEKALTLMRGNMTRMVVEVALL